MTFLIQALISICMKQTVKKIEQKYDLKNFVEFLFYIIPFYYLISKKVILLTPIAPPPLYSDIVDC